MALTSHRRSGLLLTTFATIVLGGGILASSLSASAETVIQLRAARNAGIGWQALATIGINPSTTAMFFHYACPPGAPVADAGGYAFTQAGQLNPVSVGFNGPRLDESPPFFGEWGWEFLWPGGAPANLQVQLDIHCVKK